MMTSQPLISGRKIKILNSIIIFLFIITILQQFPIIRELAYNQIRYLLYLSFGILGLHSFLKSKKFYNVSLFKWYLLLLAYFLYIDIVSRVFGRNSTMIENLIIPFGILVISINNKFSISALRILLISYSAASTLLGLFSVFYYGSGFTVLQAYLIPSKNQIGPIIGIGLIIQIFLVSQKFTRKLFDIFSILLIVSIILNMASLLAIRNRSGILGIVVVTSILVVRYSFKQKSLKGLVSFILLVIITVVFSQSAYFNKFENYAFEAVVGGYDATDINSVSAGRIDGYIDAIHYIRRHLLLGEFGAREYLGFRPHNYILYYLVRYGLLSLPLLLFYFFLWKIALSKIFTDSHGFQLHQMVLLFSLIVSNFEYSYPYGPGVSQIMLWFLLGQSVQAYKNENRSSR